MSTLLKKQYLYGRCRPLECDEQGEAVTAAAADTCSSDTTSDVSFSRKRKLEAAAAVAAEPTERPAPRKVSFKELVTIIVPSKAENGVHPPLDAEMLQEYRNDIWYSVRTFEVMLEYGQNRPNEWTVVASTQRGIWNDA
jgi:hypothetical protein